MSERPALRALAEALGIAPGYHGQTGEWHDTSDETRELLLAAMGFPAAGERAAEASLARLREEDARAGLAPVRVVEAGDAGLMQVLARLEGATSQPVHWELELALEHGELHRSRGVAAQGAGYLLALELPSRPSLGYHRLRLATEVAGRTVASEQSLIVVPPACVRADEVLHGARAFGLVANLYTMRSARNWGVGDLTDLAELTRWAGAIGAAFVGVNPLHALHNRGTEISPYSPISRLFRNPLYLDPERIPEVRAARRDPRSEIAVLVESPGFRRGLDRARTAERVDYDRVMALKRPVLRAAYEAFLEHAPAERRHAYNHWAGAREPELSDFATYMALAERHGTDWERFPDGLSEPRSDAVGAFRAAHADEVDFHRWCQWAIDEQLGEACAAGRDAGLAIGIYQDLAIGTSPSGSDVWSSASLFVRGVNVGAPPDPYSSIGQDWGLPPLDPRELRRNGYRYWIALLRAAFRHAGALRIDHVLGLFRLFWIPQGKTGREGAYVRYPAEELLGILALESARHGALVVGEDLGTVPPEVAPALRKWGILSSKVMVFERGDGGSFRAPATWEPQALATANTHDMAPLEGWWQGRDVELRIEHGLVPADEAARARADRENDQLQLRRALDDAGIATETPLRPAVHDFIAASPCVLVGVALDDLVGESDQVNLPGTGPAQYPSWQRKMRRTLEEIRDDPATLEALGTRMREERGRVR